MQVYEYHLVANSFASKSRYNYYKGMAHNHVYAWTRDKKVARAFEKSRNAKHFKKKIRQIDEHDLRMYYGKFSNQEVTVAQLYTRGPDTKSVLKDVPLTSYENMTMMAVVDNGIMNLEDETFGQIDPINPLLIKKKYVEDLYNIGYVDYFRTSCYTSLEDIRALEQLTQIMYPDGDGPIMPEDDYEFSVCVYGQSIDELELIHTMYGDLFPKRK